MSRLSYTGGSDSLVRIWQMDKDQYQEPEVAYEADEGITAIACSVRPFHGGQLPLKHNHDVPFYCISMSTGCLEAKTPKSAAIFTEKRIFMG